MFHRRRRKLILTIFVCLFVCYSIACVRIDCICVRCLVSVVFFAAIAIDRNGSNNMTKQQQKNTKTASKCKSMINVNERNVYYGLWNKTFSIWFVMWIRSLLSYKSSIKKKNLDGVTMKHFDVWKLNTAAVISYCSLCYRLLTAKHLMRICLDIGFGSAHCFRLFN